MIEVKLVHHGTEPESGGLLTANPCFPPGNRLLVRLEGRGMGTFPIDRTEVFCPEGACAVRIQGEGCLQVEFRAGLTISF